MKHFSLESKNLHPIPYTLHPSSGFTLIELLIVIAIAIVLLGFSAYAFFGGIQSDQYVDNEAKSLVAFLKGAQEKAVGQDTGGGDTGSRWAVYIDTVAGRDIYYLYQVDEAQLGSGSFNPVPGTLFDQKTLRGSLEFVLAGGATTLNIIFAKDSGLPSASTTIVLQDAGNPTFSSSVIISANGRITYQ